MAQGKPPKCGVYKDVTPTAENQLEKILENETLTGIKYMESYRDQGIPKSSVPMWGTVLSIVFGGLDWGLHSSVNYQNVRLEKLSCEEQRAAPFLKSCHPWILLDPKP